MGYLGQQPTIGAYHVLDSITLSNGQSAYTMQLDGANFSPQSVNHMLVIINGVPQPASAYSINGHTLTLSSAATTGDVLNEIRVFGDVLNIGTPSDATVTNAKTNFVSTSSAAGLQIKGDGTTDGTLQLNCSQNSHGVKIASPNHAAGQSYTLTLPSTAPSNGKALITDGSGNLSFGSAGGLVKLAEVTDSTNQSEIEFTGLYAYGATYQTLIISHSHATGSGEVRFAVKGYNESSYYSTAYYWTSIIGRPNGNITGYGQTNSSYGKLLGSYGESHGFRGDIIIHDPRNASNGSRVAIEYLQTFWSAADSSAMVHGVVGVGTTTGVDAIKYYFASSNFGAGNAVLYGVLK